MIGQFKQCEVRILKQGVRKLVWTRFQNLWFGKFETIENIESVCKTVFVILYYTTCSVSYLQECLSEMESAWVDVMNNRLSEFGEQLLSMFLWGIQPPELAQFLSAEMDRKSFNEIAVNTRQKCSFGNVTSV